MKKLVIWLTMLSGLVMFLAPLAHADVGGQVPGPGNCNYPAIGTWGLDGVAVYDWTCDYPTEVNGSHNHCQMIGVAGNAQVGVGVNIFMFNASASISGAVGVLRGACWWACPDLSLAAEPNPVMTWQGAANAAEPVERTKCKAIGPNPLAPQPTGDNNGGSQTPPA